MKYAQSLKKKILCFIYLFWFTVISYLFGKKGNYNLY